MASVTFSQYMINDLVVTAPEAEIWTHNVIGVALNSLQRRSPYQTLVWRREVSDDCRLDWHDFDNTTLSSLTTREPGSTKQWRRYTDVVCIQVTSTLALNNAVQIEAMFMVNTTL